MKIKNTAFSLTLLLFVSIVGSGQINPPTNNRRSSFNFEGTLAGNNMMRGRNVLEEIMAERENEGINVNKIEGKPYFDDTFKKASLTYKDSIQIGEYLTRYHAYADELEISNSGNIGVLNKADFVRVHLDGVTYRPLNYRNDKGKITKGFFIEKVVVENAASLFLKKSKILDPGKQAETSFHEAEPPSYISKEDYFLKFKNTEPLLLNLRKNKVINSFPNNKAELKKYLNKENLDLKSEDDLIQLVSYYNSLQ